MTSFAERLRQALRRRRGKEARRLLDAPPAIRFVEARDLARHADPEVRRRLASRPDMRPEILYYLAEDPISAVRREIAANQATPAQADLSLAGDADPSVRGDLAQKIARLAPGLSPGEQDRLRRMTYEALQLLARDQITVVRQILAEALKDVANAPPEVIRQLAHDSEVVVASPVLEFSPVLTDEDLLEIIRSCPVAGALSAIGRRKMVTGPVADAISRTDDVEAIAVLLANPSAQIREETLDLLLDRAPDHESWHGPLVRRPQLSSRTANRLARFVADNLLEVLEKRTDLDAATKAAVAAQVHRRLEERAANATRLEHGKYPGKQDIELPEEAALRLFRANALTAQTILAALDANDPDFVMSALALKAGVSKKRVEKIFAMENAKGVVSLVWTAGYDMPLAVTLQARLARIPPADLLRPRQGGQAFPLTSEEMVWQMGLFASLVNEDAAPPAS
jgi:uncharacterized protein (DUF2336 family)